VEAYTGDYGEWIPAKASPEGRGVEREAARLKAERWRQMQ
jgi:hypothetical protein